MNKFTNGFSDSSYDDLSSKYAGNALGNSPRKKTAPKRNSELNTNLPKRNTVSRQEDFKPMKSFEEENLDRFFKKSDTMEFRKIPRSTQPVIEKRNDAKKSPAVSRRSSVKSSAQKRIYSDSTSPKSQQPKSRKKKKKNIAKALKKTLIISSVCVVIAVIFSCIILSCINDVLAIKSTDGKVVEVTLPNDADTKTALKILDDAGLIKNRLFCELFIKAMGYTDDNYLPGVYYFTADMGVEKMISRFKTSVQRGKIISITIPEGYTIDQIFTRLEKNDICSASSLYKVVDEIDFSDEYAFIQKIDNKEARYHALEGYFYPATYEFEQGANPGDVIRTFLDTFQKRWTEDYEKKAQALGMTTDEIIILASIIEKEGANEDQFKTISSVLHNRLNRSGLYPTLDCDSTKDYVTNTISQRITTASKINSYIISYSTYERAGLPVGAICNPGSAAIEAALNPETSQYYYFAHDKNKKIYMAATLDEHNANRRTIEKVNAQEE